MRDESTILDQQSLGAESQKIQDKLGEMIIGQPEPVMQITRTLQIFHSGICSTDRPLGVYLLVGRTGTGKTHTVESLADVMLGGRKKFIKISCGEFKEKQNVMRILGAPPGYRGHNTKTVVNEQSIKAVADKKTGFWILLFDEMEKAHSAFYPILLEVFDKGTMTDGKNNVIDYSKCLIFMTSNLGTDDSNLIQGFTGSGSRDWARELTINDYLTALRKKFSAEFINRIDHIISYKSLSHTDIELILIREIKLIEERLHNKKFNNVSLILGEDLKSWLVDKALSPRYGMRPLKRMLEKKIVEPFANFIETGQLEKDDQIQVELDELNPEGDFIFIAR